MLVRAAERLQCSAVAGDQRALLPAAPALDLLLSLPGLGERPELLVIDEPNRSAGGCVRSASALRVRPDTLLEVRSGAHVERAIAAPQDVDPGHQPTMPSSRLRGQGLRRGVAARGTRRGRLEERAWTSRRAGTERVALGSRKAGPESSGLPRARKGSPKAGPGSSGLPRVEWPATSEERLAEGEPFRVEWCERGDSNPHALASASPSSWCVCQFRHFRR